MTGFSNLRQDVVPGLRHHIARVDLSGPTSRLGRPHARKLVLVPLHRAVIETVEQVNHQPGTLRLGESKRRIPQRFGPSVNNPTLQPGSTIPR